MLRKYDTAEAVLLATASLSLILMLAAFAGPLLGV